LDIHREKKTWRGRGNRDLEEDKVTIAKEDSVSRKYTWQC